MFEDEFGFSFTWAPRGQTKGVGKYRREVSTMVGVTLSFTSAILGGPCAPTTWSSGFRRHLRRRCILVWDRSPAHRAKRVQDYLATQLSLNGCHHTPRISTRRNTVKTASKELDTRANPTWNWQWVCPFTMTCCWVSFGMPVYPSTNSG